MSTSESKKKSSKKDDKKTDDVPVEEVHTANNWENADLGDSQRKQKFLRLMGAKKRKDESEIDRQNSNEGHQDEDVSPEKKHCRSKAETEIINRELEKQFNESLQSKITHTNHGGLGFHGESSGASSSNDWQHQLTKTKFVAAKTDEGASMEHVAIETTKKDDEEEKPSDKQEKKKKRKS
ncbi:hypothetical protein I4U23_014365 [Adineta vaga]|nr:hypothetical protein I4U23_014365 [Adineta vaga]